jgi:hypothetical protein
MPRGPRKYDAKTVEHEYVTGDISLRALAEAHDVAFSSLAAFARRNDWAGKRIAYRSALSRRSYEVMAAEAGNLQGLIRDDSIKLLRAQLAVHAEQLAARKVPISPKDAVEAIRTLAELLKEPEGGGADGPVVVNGTARTLNADLLRRVAEAARGQLATEGVLAGTADGEHSRTRPN